MDRPEFDPAHFSQILPLLAKNSASAFDGPSYICQFRLRYIADFIKKI